MPEAAEAAVLPAAALVATMGAAAKAVQTGEGHYLAMAAALHIGCTAGRVKASQPMWEQRDC